MSIADLSPDAVLAVILAGHRTRGELAAEFEVLPSSMFLSDAIRELTAGPEPLVFEAPDGRLIPRPRKPEEDR